MPMNTTNKFETSQIEILRPVKIYNLPKIIECGGHNPNPNDKPSLGLNRLLAVGAVALDGAADKSWAACLIVFNPGTRRGVPSGCKWNPTALERAHDAVTCREMFLSLQPHLTASDSRPKTEPRQALTDIRAKLKKNGRKRHTES